MQAGDLYTAAGALPVATPGGRPTTARAGCAPRWATPVGVAVSPSGALFYADAGLGTVRVIARGRGTVSRFGRRTFLASSAGVAAGAALPLGPGRPRHRGGCSGRRRRARRRHAGPAGSLRAGGSRSTASSTPWGSTPTTARSPGRCRRRAARARRRPPHRGPAHRPRPRRARLGQRPVASARQAFVAYAGPALAADAAYAWTVQAAGGARRVGAGLGAGPLHHGLRAGDWAGASGCARPAARSSPTASPTCAPRSPRPPAPWARHGLRLRRPHLPALRGRRAGRRLAQLLLSRRAVRARRRPDRRAGRGRRSAIGVLHRWYGPGQGRPASLPGLLFQLSLWYADGRHVVFGSDGSWREHPAEWLPSPQRNSDGGDFVEWVDGRAHPQGWSSPASTTARGPGPVIGPAGTRAVHRHLRAADHHPRDPGHPIRVHTLPAARSWPTSGPSTRRDHAVAFARACRDGP